MKNKVNYLYIAFLLELVFLFYRKNELGVYLSPLFFTGAGLFLAIFPYFLQKKSKPELAELFLETNGERIQITRGNLRIIAGVFVLFVIVFGIWLGYFIRQFPIDVNQSDIIPFIEDIFLKRWDQGIPVYSTYEGFGYGAFHPNYMPLHWMSFLVSYYGGFDHRWMLYIIYSLSVFIYLYVLLLNFSSWKRIVFLLFLPFLLVFSILESQGKDAVHTVEIIILGFYLILGLSIFSRNYLVQAFGLLLPLLSRYSFVFWLPVHFISWIKTDGKRFIWVSVFGAILLGVFLVPFIISSPDMFEGFNSNYMIAAMREWGGQSWQQPGDNPFQLFHGIGFAAWFYNLYPGPLEARISALMTTLKFTSLFSMIGLMLLTPRIKKVLSANMFSLLSLKFILTLFYAFVTIPYLYLNWVSLIISIVILSRIAEPKLEKETAI
ncbi:MAG: hypothetical protein K9I36_04100 [Bacteroidia bacterium]|nr:hypothetical protein [Bacteroidia bacterium]MCF8425892.1 hypothetical protein [Bacteroidia bacterium]